MPYSFAHGSGTSADPFQIWTAADLNGVRDWAESDDDTPYYFKQMADIDLSAYNPWAPIGVSTYCNFGGNYNGNGFKISNLTVNGNPLNSYNRYCGLFGSLWEYYSDSGGNPGLENIALENVNISGGYRVGALCGEAEVGQIKNCTVDGGTVSGDYEVGGLVGESYNSIQNCKVENIVAYAQADCGLLVGKVMWDAASEVINCAASGVINITYSSPSWVGGLIGFNRGSVINCYVRAVINGNLTVDFGGLGGFIGCNDDDGTIENCYAATEMNILIVTPKGYTGNFIGENSGTITGSYYDHTVSGSTYNNGTGIPKTTAQMKSQSTFTGWDFDDVWAIKNDYPYLQFEETSLALQTRKAYALVEACSESDPNATMNYNGQWYKFVAWLEEFEATVHEEAGESVAYEYGGSTITYSGQDYTFLASGITDPDAAGGYGSYLSDTSRTVESLADRENFVNFYYIYPPLGQVKQPVWAKYKLTWEDVENAASYIVRLYNESGGVVSMQTVNPGVKLFDFSSILSAGTFTATVQASEVTPV